MEHYYQLWKWMLQKRGWKDVEPSHAPNYITMQHPDVKGYWYVSLKSQCPDRFGESFSQSKPDSIMQYCKKRKG